MGEITAHDPRSRTKSRVPRWRYHQPSGPRWAETPTAEALDALAKRRLPRPLVSPQQVLDDPQSMRRLSPVARVPVERRSKVPRRRLSETPATIRSRPPTIGEHTTAIMTELGYSAAQIADLRESKVI